MNEGARWFWATLVFWLASCGGNGTPAYSVAPAAPRFVHHAYFGGDPTTAAETFDHVDGVMVTGWNGAPGNDWWQNVARELSLARQAGIHRATIALPACRAARVDLRPALLEQLRLLAGTGELDGWDALDLYWCDEPATPTTPEDDPERIKAAPLSEETVRSAVAWLRTFVLPAFPALARARLPVIYACEANGAPGPTPGFTVHDVVMCDWYHGGCNALRYADDYRARLSPGQRLGLVPGGSEDADPTDPTCFKQYAFLHPEVDTVWSFLWMDRQNIKGIRSDGWADTWRAFGHDLLGRP